jgi:AGZA family xanthine/uracil permease-like MFS transporter
MLKKLAGKIEEYFEFSRYGTNWRTELLAGLATYLSLAYIFIVNPSILSNAHMDISAVLFATVIASGLTTIAMGLWARLPFCVAPGLEMDGFFAFVVVGTMGLTWQEALGAVFWSGVLCVIFSVKGIRQHIIDAIPDGLKKSMAISVGVFVFTIGLYLAGIVAFNKGAISSIAIHGTPKEISLLVGLVLSAALAYKKLRFPAGILVAIIVCAFYCNSQGIVQAAPAHFSKEMFSGVLKLDVIPHSLRVIPVFLVFFLIDFYGSIGKFVGLTASTNLVDKKGNLARFGNALYVDGAGTIGSGLVGTSSVITYVESAVGISMGGRTGVVAIVCGLLMLLSLVFTPLVGLVPVEATSGILCYVGYLLFSSALKDKHLSRPDFAIIALMAAVTFATFNLGQAMALGFLAYTVVHFYKVFRGNMKINWWLAGSTVAVILSVILQYIIK